ncbi:MAG: hypothetical protein ACR2PA_00185 [Hyphomicrobiaceae bacterium]
MQISEIESDIERCTASISQVGSDRAEPLVIMDELLRVGEAVLELWVRARGQEPTVAKREGFRLLALHRQGCKGDPSFNACRETCRELCYYYNLIATDQDHPDTSARLKLASLVAKHLYLFVSGKMQVEELGEFCCSSRPVRGSNEMLDEHETSN